MDDILYHTYPLYIPILGRYFSYNITSIVFHGETTIRFARRDVTDLFSVRLRSTDGHRSFLEWIQKNSIEDVFEMVIVNHSHTLITIRDLSSMTLEKISHFWTDPSRSYMEFILHAEDIDSVCNFHLLDLYEMGYFSKIHNAHVGMFPIHECFIGVKVRIWDDNDYINFSYTLNNFRLDMVLEDLMESFPSQIDKDIRLLIEEIPFVDNQQYNNVIDLWKQTSCVNIVSAMVLWKKLEYPVLRRLHKILDWFDRIRITSHVSARVHFQYDNRVLSCPSPLLLKEQACVDSYSHHCGDESSIGQDHPDAADQMDDP